MTGQGPVRALLADGRWHFQHGPIDLVIGIDGDAGVRAAAIEDCWLAFTGVLRQLVVELQGLRSPSTPSLRLQGPVAVRMARACAPYARDFGLFITPMAAVAGAVADHLIVTLRRAGIARAYINNGGDIALHLTEGTSFDVGVVANAYAPRPRTSGGQRGDFATRQLCAAGATRACQRAALVGGGGTGISRQTPPSTHSPHPNAPPQAGEGIDAALRIDASMPVRGIATSGWRGRSFSLGIADSVTVLAADGATADAAATMIANEVDIEHPAIERAPADSLRDDTDLGSRLVTVDVPCLPRDDVEAALDNGLAFARRCRDRGLIHAALLTLQGRTRMLNPHFNEVALT
ncbi:MAG TPA: UPF0280 family protein [Burkholderiaceae bacterium]|nr:UPF0280 family protein [Burkholderiaceae bacterium]